MNYLDKFSDVKKSNYNYLWILIACLIIGLLMGLSSCGDCQAQEVSWKFEIINNSPDTVMLSLDKGFNSEHRLLFYPYGTYTSMIYKFSGKEFYIKIKDRYYKLSIDEYEINLK